MEKSSRVVTSPFTAPPEEAARVLQAAEELARLKRELAMPDSYTAARGKRAPRSKINRPRIRR